MAILVGFQAKKFTFEDGNTVEGYYLHTEEQLNGVTGTAVDRTFVSQKKLADYIPKIGDEIQISYNKYGKPQSVIKIK